MLGFSFQLFKIFFLSRKSKSLNRGKYIWKGGNHIHGTGMMQHEWHFQRTADAQVKKYSYCIRSRYCWCFRLLKLRTLINFLIVKSSVTKVTEKESTSNVHPRKEVGRQRLNFSPYFLVSLLCFFSATPAAWTFWFCKDRIWHEKTQAAFWCKSDDKGAERHAPGWCRERRHCHNRL